MRAEADAWKHVTWQLVLPGFLEELDPVTPTPEGQRAWILPGGGTCPLYGLQMPCRQLENVIREIRMINWSNGVVVFHVGRKGKSTKLKKGWKKKASEASSRNPSAGREPGK